MDIKYQDPKDLYLGVTSAHKIQDLTVLASAELELGDLSIVFRVIGESHWVTISRKGAVVFQEVLACVDLEGPHWQHQHSFQNGKTHSWAYGDYEIRVTFEPMSEAIARFGNTQQLEVRFPHPLGEGDAPFTRVWWEVGSDQIKWWTFHVYPLKLETIAVLTKSAYRR